jgi:hypothetical protein
MGANLKPSHRNKGTKRIEKLYGMEIQPTIPMEEVEQP